jgi:hypothetical protein
VSALNAGLEAGARRSDRRPVPKVEPTEIAPKAPKAVKKKAPRGTSKQQVKTAGSAARAHATRPEEGTAACTGARTTESQRT